MRRLTGGGSPPRRTPPRRGQTTYVRPARLPLPVNGYLAQIASPDPGFRTFDKRPVVTVVGTEVLASGVDLQVEWRRQRPYQPWGLTHWLPEPTYTVEHLGQSSGGDVLSQPPVEVELGRWYVRARAGSVDDDLWSEWTASDYWIEVYPVLGSVTEYIDMNVGVSLPSRSALAYLEMNVGAEEPGPLGRTLYLEMNVGMKVSVLLAGAYSEMNVYPVAGDWSVAANMEMEVTTNRPVPHIWWIRPEQGKEGFVFHIFGHGFGDFAGEYDGAVYLGALVCPVIRWEVVAQTAVDDAGLLIQKGSGLDSDVITVEHGWLTVLVPSGAVSAMVKVVLEGT